MAARFLVVALAALVLGTAAVCYRDVRNGDALPVSYAAPGRAPTIHWGGR
jgi:hypothetical protein